MLTYRGLEHGVETAGLQSPNSSVVSFEALVGSAFLDLFHSSIQILSGSNAKYSMAGVVIMVDSLCW
jgi:hypothetical protein